MRAAQWTITLGFCFGFVAPSVSAQAPQPSYQTQPAVSPYLNLTRAGTNMAINYYGIVRPQIDFRNSIQSLQTQVDNLGAGGATDNAGGGLPATGHKTQFMNYAKYFGVTSSGGSAARTGANPAPIRAPHASQPPKPGAAAPPIGP
jgi:hypothetical protein